MYKYGVYGDNFIGFLPLAGIHIVVSMVHHRLPLVADIPCREVGEPVRVRGILFLVDYVLVVGPILL